MGARSKHVRVYGLEHVFNSRVPRWGHDQNSVAFVSTPHSIIAECPDGGTIKTTLRFLRVI